MGPNSFPWVHDSDGGYPPVNSLEEAIDRLISLQSAINDLRDGMQFNDTLDVCDWNASRMPTESPEEFIDLGTP